MDIEADHDEAPRAILASGDPLSRRTVAEALRAADITLVAEAGTGAEAIELTTFYRPDLIVMDVDVKSPDGIEATRIISERAPDVRIVLLAADSEDAAGIRAIRAGA